MRFAIRYEFIAKQPIFDNRKHVKPGCKRTLGSSRDDVASNKRKKMLGRRESRAEGSICSRFHQCHLAYAAVQRIQIIGVSIY